MTTRSPEDYSASVATTLAISVDQLRREEPRAVDLLNLCAFPAPEPIPRSLLTEHQKALPAALGKAVGSPLRLNRLIGALRRYNLVEVTGGDLVLHRSVQAATRDRLSEAKRRRWVEAAAGLMSVGFPCDRNDPKTWAPSGALLAHALAAAGHAFETAKDLENTRWLFNQTARYLETRAEFAGARVGYARALALAEAALGPDDPEVATYVNNLGLVLQALGDLAGARAAFERALGIDEASFGKDHPNVAIRVNNLGGVLQDLGDLAGARAAFERALGIDEASFGKDHPKVARGVNNLGSVLWALGDLAGARAAFERALPVFEKHLGPQHPSVATLINNLGSVLQDLGDLAGARAAYERALGIDEASFGKDHPNVAIGVNNLGSVLRDLGDLAGARAAFERALAICERMLGPDHPNTRTVRGNLESLGDGSGPSGRGPS